MYKEHHYVPVPHKNPKNNSMKKKLMLTIDLEWYYNGNERGSVEDFSKKTLEERYAYDNGQIEKSVNTILKILDAYNQKITFFVVAEIDKVYPKVIKKIFKEGHEISIHSYRHDEFNIINDFKRDLKKCSNFQKEYKVIGFRSPRIKINKQQHDVLHAFGYKYDSSVFGTTRFDNSNIEILPISVLPYFNKKHIQHIPSPLNINLLRTALPFGGGMFVGFFQKSNSLLISRYTKIYQEPPCLFIHSWQVNQPYYPWKFLAKNPWMIPYSFESKNLVEYFCAHYRLVRIKDYIFH